MKPSSGIRKIISWKIFAKNMGTGDMKQRQRAWECGLPTYLQHDLDEQITSKYNVF